MPIPYDILNAVLIFIYTDDYDHIASEYYTKQTEASMVIGYIPILYYIHVVFVQCYYPMVYYIYTTYK